LEGDKGVEEKILELMAAATCFIPSRRRELDKPFLMPIEDVFTITGRGGTVVDREGGAAVGSTPVTTSRSWGVRPTAEDGRATGVEMFRKILDEGHAGDNIGALLRGTKKEERGAGSGVVQAGFDHARTPSSRVRCMCWEERGGRHKPFFNNYRPQFFFRTTDVTGTIQLPEGTEM
jgi:elongation factor Tu